MQASATAPAPASSMSMPGPALAGTARADSPRRSDPLWIRAKDEDPLERARLAEAVGASGLLEGVEDGGEVALTALAALPYADDAEIALRRLSEVALASGAGEVRPVLTAILAIAGRPERSREAPDPEGVRACGEAMIVLADRASFASADRALAVSAARALAEKGYVDPKRIPSTLDAK